jgi:hypothetical protein
MAYHQDDENDYDDDDDHVAVSQENGFKQNSGGTF